MRIPEGFVGLLSDPVMSSGVHQHHTQEHDMPSNTAGPRKMALYGQFGAKSILLDVVEARIISMALWNGSSTLT